MAEKRYPNRNINHQHEQNNVKKFKQHIEPKPQTFEALVLPYL